MNKESFFDDVGPDYEGVAEFYELFADNNDLPFYLKYAKKYGSPILDVAAGTGRVSRFLAEHGFLVTALESSPSMLVEAEKKLQSVDNQIRERIDLLSGDMTDFFLGEKYSMVIIPNSFGHAMTTEDQLSTLSSIHNHLADDGVFILDLFPGATMNEHAKFQDSPVSFGDCSVIREGEFHVDFVRQILRLDLRYIVSNEDGSEEEIFEVTSGASIIYNREADLLVHQTGFEVVEELGGFDSQPYTPESGRRILILRKREQ